MVSLLLVFKPTVSLRLILPPANRVLVLPHDDKKQRPQLSVPFLTLTPMPSPFHSSPAGNNLPWSPQEKLCYSLLCPKNPKPSPRSLLQITAFLLRRPLLHSNLQLLTLLISSLASSHPRHARRLFDLRTSQDSFLCNSMIQSLVADRNFHESVSLYRDLRRRGEFSPDTYTFPSLLKSCAVLHAEGLQLHAHLIRMGFCGDPFCSTALLDMYSKDGDMGSARKVFDGMPDRSPAAWNPMIVGYAKAGDLGAAVGFFEWMPEKDTVAINAMIDAFVKFGDMDSANRLFGGMKDRNVVTWTSLISGYSKIGDMEVARTLFEEMPVKNLFTWNVMIGGYCKNNEPHRALELFQELQSDSCPFQPDQVTIVSVMPAISSAGAVDLGRWVHRYARKNGLDRCTNVSTALMDMYFKCGDIQEARRVFDLIAVKEIASWNAMINGLAVNGQATEALDVFSEMTKTGLRPNEVTMIGVLSACTHGGLVEEGKKWFRSMDDLGIERRIDHYGCMVDLLGRRGHLDEAERLVEEMPYGPNGIILSSLLFACVCHKDVERGERVVQMGEKIEPGNVRNYVMLRNLFAEERRWGDVERIKEVIRSFGGKKKAGCSAIEVGRSSREFVSGDKSHPEWERICGILGKLQWHMRRVREEKGIWEVEVMG